ncbi:MAG: polyphosphate:AMP phosphotransferase [Chromatiales bacterium]|nr:polyphosphate:AMP phosphotransferase [Chromatiales bacterium]
MLEKLKPVPRVSRADYARTEADLRVDLVNAQYDLRRARYPVIVLVAGDDRVGINETVQLLQHWMDARYLVTRVFVQPSEAERERPLFWRYWRALPPHGSVGLHVGSWATSLVRERLKGSLDAAAFARRLGWVRQFERELVDDGALLIKFWLHISRKELGKRLGKFTGPDDEYWQVENSDRRAYRDHAEMVALIEDMFAVTHTARAPWFAVRSAQSRARNLAVATQLRDALHERMSLRRRRPSRVPQSRGSYPDALGGVQLDERFEDYDRYRRARRHWQTELGRLTRAGRDRGRSAILVFEGWDAAGKGGAIRRLTQAMSVRDYRVIPVGAPTDEEQAHHYLWRFWRHLLPPGRVLIFDRSWYGRVLVERVEGFARPDEWERAYQEICDFEAQLTGHGIVLCKFWLHIDRREQLRRFRAREKTAYKKYKITEEDYRNREQWEAYSEAVNEMVARTDTGEAPWHLVPANDKRWARVEVLKTVCRALAA